MNTPTATICPPTPVGARVLALRSLTDPDAAMPATGQLHIAGDDASYRIAGAVGNEVMIDPPLRIDLATNHAVSFEV